MTWVCVGWCLVGTANAFYGAFHHRRHRTISANHRLGTEARSTVDPIAEMDEERRQNLFQALLRDLQIENVPLLGCDAHQVETMNAAIWTTMAELSECNDAQKVCIVLEDIPMNALKAFETDYKNLLTQQRLMKDLPELTRINVNLLGKGVGPALVIESSQRSPQEIQERNERASIEHILHETPCTTALKSFVNRIVVGQEACPYTKNADIAGVGLEARGVSSGPVAYRYNGSSDICAAVAAFWTCVCELKSVPETQVSTTLLSLPAIGWGTTPQAHDRFKAAVELIGRSLCLFRGDGVFGLVHFHPAYDRTNIHPRDSPAFGHLPPRSWLRPMLRFNGNMAEAESLTEEDLAMSDYQRRSPHTMINILRVSQLNAAVGAKSIVDLPLDDGRVEKASGITLYSRNAIRLAKVGREELQAALDVEIAMET